MERKNGGSFLKLPKLFKKKGVKEAKPAEDPLGSVPPDVREKIEKEIKYHLSVSQTPQQIYTHLQESGHPADKFAEFINDCYLTDFIHDSFTRGFTMEQIREELENWNWPREKIEWGLNNLLKKK